MKGDSSLSRFAPTKAGLVVSIFICLVALTLTILLVRTPTSESLSDWTPDWPHPQRSPFSVLTNGDTRTLTFSTTNSFTNVVNWYSDYLHVARGGGPSFNGRASGFFGGGVEQIGQLGTTNSEVATRTFLVYRKGRAFIAHISSSRDNPLTDVFVTMCEVVATTNGVHSANVLTVLAPPSSVRGSGGWMMNMAAHVFTDTNRLVELNVTWSPTRDKTLTSGISGAWLSNEFYQATVVPLNKMARESDLLFLTPGTMSLIHIGTKPDGTSELTIGTIVP